VSVHRTDCVNVKDLLNDEERLIDVYWFDDLNGSYKVEVEILANDRNGLLKDIIKQIENNKIRLTGMNSRTTKEGIAIIDLSLELENTDSLNKALSSFRNVENVYEVHRKRN
jgi:GTP pyrophosphokinase